MNLYEAVPETSLLGLQVCRDLIKKRVGASVGMAMGPSFCGVTGSRLSLGYHRTGRCSSYPSFAVYVRDEGLLCG